MKFFFSIIIFFFISKHAFSVDQKNTFTINIEELIATKNKINLIGSIKKGEKLFASRKVNCLSCHEAPIKREKFQGNFGPSLERIGSSYTKDELRLRIINPKIINPNTVMPAYFVKIKYPRTAKKYFNKTILSEQEVENLVEYLYSLK